MRGVYWAHMSEYAGLNFFNAENPLPSWFWTGETKMACVGHAIRQSLDYSYAHHIQRLMVTGNFMLLAGIDPDEIDRWYLGVYIDAIEWVEITNTRGMSQFADGGIVGTKPYAASANYMKKMGPGTTAVPSTACTGISTHATGPSSSAILGLAWLTALGTRWRPRRGKPCSSVGTRCWPTLKTSDHAQFNLV